MQRFSLVTLWLACMALSSATSSSDDNNTNNNIDLFTWAKQHGAKISSDTIAIQSTPYGGRGLYATQNIPANTNLITIPYHLQLGVRQLAQEGSDTDMQSIIKSLDWKFIIKEELGFIPLSIALLAEKRKGASSIFYPFLSELPSSCDNAVSGTRSTKLLDGTRSTNLLDDVYGNSDGDSSREGTNSADLNNLMQWAPHIAKKVQQKRNGITAIYKSIIAPTSSSSSSPTSSSSSILSLQDLIWSATNVCSRSLVRKRIQELTSDQVTNIGEFAASDHSRMLPIIDMVNHGSNEHANVLVGHFSSSSSSREVEDNDDDDIILDDNNNDDFSTSLKSTRDIKAGEELLFDYGGGGKKISNDRLLLDYGFVLPDGGHTDRVSLHLTELYAVLSQLDKEGHRVGMQSVSKEDMIELDTLVKFLMKQAADMQDGMPLLFMTRDGDDDGIIIIEPSIQTLALTIVMTCRDQNDVSRVLKPAHEVSTQEQARLLPHRIIEDCNEMQRLFAEYTLKLVATLALDQRPSPTIDSGDGDDNINTKNSDNCKEEEDGKEKEGDISGSSNFANVAREYSILCRDMLRQVADMSR